MTDDRVSYLYRTYGPVILARCRRILRDAAAAEDAMQETFVRVHHHLDRVPDDRAGRREALQWIYRVATNHCLHELRRTRGQATPVSELPELAGRHPADALEQANLVERLVARVSPKLAEVAWLHHVDGMEQAEVAEVLGISRGTVINRLRAFEESARRFVEQAS